MPVTLHFRTGSGSAAIPAGTPAGYVFRPDGLYIMGESPDDRHLFVAPPFEVCGWNSRGAITLRNPAGCNLVSVAGTATLSALRTAMAQIGALPPDRTALRHLATYLDEVRQPTGSLWRIETEAAA